MPLPSGSRRGPYEILAPLGAGGMGEVYRARDTRLNRDVAIKALPAEFASDSERLARFQREARLLASLNHANIAAIYGLEEADGARYLVLEIVEGESLAQRLAAGPLPVEEALAVCAQAAAGVSAAHEAGVIHRDLKPGNVMVRPDGSVKVLDFGLAKSAEEKGPASDLSASPTVSVGTQTGVILGTAAYMSPEQSRGRVLDKRTDIWSFGCILYECLTGSQVFREETVSDTLASIIRSEPDWTALPAETPQKIRDLLRRCLQKDPKRRLHDIADARIEIEEALASPAQAPAATELGGAAPSRRVPPLLWIGLGLVAGAILGALLLKVFSAPPRREMRPAVRSTISLPSETRLWSENLRPSWAFSSDGRRLVFRAIRGDASQLYLRELSRPDAEPIPGTQRGFNPFFSPDGEWIAFFTLNDLRKVALSGGAPAAVSSIPPVSWGGSWAADGSIIVAPRSNSGLERITAGGNALEAVTQPDFAHGEHAHVLPQALPGGREVLLVVRAGRDFDDLPSSNVAVQSLATGKRRTLVEGASWARYVEPGYLLYAKGTTIFAARCDPRTWALIGPAVPLLRDVLTGAYDAVPYLAVSDTGLIAYARGGTIPARTGQVLWVDRRGKEEALPLSGVFFNMPRISPDGKRIALVTHQPDTPRSAVAIYDLGRGVLSTLTPEPGRHFAPIWSPDGRRVVYTTFETASPRLTWKASDGAGDAEWLTPGGFAEFPCSISPDGHVLLYTTSAASERMNLWSLSLDDKREKRAWLSTQSSEIAAFFSPDGRAVIYVSNESGKNEVYVRPFPGPGPKIKVSSDGGTEPAWAPSGREVFYRTSDALMAVPITTQPELSAGTARAVIPDHYTRWGREDGSRNYDVSPDGSRFLVVKALDRKEEPITQIQLIENWPAELPAPEAAKR
ncbi:MAG TPA: protein kinase [Thermoanaerobaculia bacterium]|nr:protein kinase [Thermoanaerobaculia bacterium]